MKQKGLCNPFLKVLSNQQHLRLIIPLVPRKMSEMATLETDQLYVQCVDGMWIMKAPESMDWNVHALATQNVMMLQQFQMIIQQMEMQNGENVYLRSQVAALEATIHGMSLRKQSEMKIPESNKKQMIELEERVKALLEETDMLKTGNDMMQQTFLTHKEKEKSWESSHLDLESKYSAQKSELDVEISNLKKDLEKKTENLRKSSESQRTMSMRIREFENEQSSLSQENQRLLDEISEKTRLIEKIRSTPPPPPIVSAPSSEEKRLKDRLTNLEREFKLAREKAREFDRLKPIFDDVEMNYHILKSRQGTYEEAVNALTTAHDGEMSKLTASIAAKDLIIKQQEERMKQMSLQNQRALRELGETEKTSIQAVRELERKLQVANYDLSSLRERNKHSEKDLHEATATKEDLDVCRQEVASLRNRIESFERISNDAVQRLKSVLRKKNELQIELDGSKSLIKRYRSHIGDLPEETQQMVDTTPESDDESV